MAVIQTGRCDKNRLTMPGTKPVRSFRLPLRGARSGRVRASESRNNISPRARDKRPTSNVQYLLHSPLSNTYRNSLHVRRVLDPIRPLVNHIFGADSSVPPIDINGCFIPGQATSRDLVRQSLDVNVERHTPNENPGGRRSTVPD